MEIELVENHADLYMTDLNVTASNIAKWRERQGFETPNSLDDSKGVLYKLMLVVTELSEAVEAVRCQDDENFREEIADTFIRLLDLTGTMGIDIEQEIVDKMLVNETRPYKHGKSL